MKWPTELIEAPFFAMGDISSPFLLSDTRIGKDQYLHGVKSHWFYSFFTLTPRQSFVILLTSQSWACWRIIEMILVNSMNLQRNVLKNNQLLNYRTFLRLLRISAFSVWQGVINCMINKALFLFFMFCNVQLARYFFSKRELLNKSINCIGG